MSLDLDPVEARALAPAIARYLHYLRNNRARLARRYSSDLDGRRIDALAARERILGRVLARLDAAYPPPPEEP